MRQHGDKPVHCVRPVRSGFGANMLANTRYVCTVWGRHRGIVIENIADEVERLYGFGVCVIALGGSTCGDALLISKDFPTHEQAWAYARELYLAAVDGKFEEHVRR